VCLLFVCVLVNDNNDLAMVCDVMFYDACAAVMTMTARDLQD